MSVRTSTNIEETVLRLLSEGFNNTEVGIKVGVSEATVRRIHTRVFRDGDGIKERHDETKNNMTISVKSLNIKTLAEALKHSDVDLEVWEVDRHIVNSWEITMKTGQDKKPETFTNYQVKVWLKRKNPDILVLEEILRCIQESRPLIPPIKYQKPKRGQGNKMLEISLFDIHFGLRCYAPAADRDWTPEMAREMTLNVLEKLLTDAEPEGPFDYILLPLGNDFFHCDNVFHTTTAGTSQPEADSWHHTYLMGEAFAVEMIERCKEVAPVKIKMIAGNHARQSEYTLGRFLWAYYRNDSNVEIDASASPYKFEHYGVNLIGYEHGHSVKQIRLAALMANECREAWSQTVYREWHLGDQHRKGSSKPSVHEEQGVSVEFLPGLVMPNEWHRLKSFNWQKRMGMAFVWDKEAGPIMRLQVNINSYTGKLMR